MRIPKGKATKIKNDKRMRRAVRNIVFFGARPA